MACSSLYCSLGKTSCQELSKHHFNLVSQFGECVSKTCSWRREGGDVQDEIFLQPDALRGKTGNKMVLGGRTHGISGPPDLPQRSEGSPWRRGDHLQDSNGSLRCDSHIQHRVFPGIGEVMEDSSSSLGDSQTPTPHSVFATGPMWCLLFCSDRYLFLILRNRILLEVSPCFPFYSELSLALDGALAPSCWPARAELM